VVLRQRFDKGEGVYDPKQVDSLRIRHEAGMAEIVTALDRSVARFRDALTTRREQRKKLSESLDKMTDRRRETVRSLKELVRQNDQNKKELRRARAEQSHLKKDEAVILDSYKDLLAGHPPAYETNRDPVVSANPGELKARSARYLASMQDAFGSLEQELATLKKRDAELIKEINDLASRISRGEKRRETLFTKLALYKEEARQTEEKLDESATTEQAILNEYIYYARRLKEVVHLTPAAESLLTQTFRLDRGAE